MPFCWIYANGIDIITCTIPLWRPFFPTDHSFRFCTFCNKYHEQISFVSFSAMKRVLFFISKFPIVGHSNSMITGNNQKKWMKSWMEDKQMMMRRDVSNCSNTALCLKFISMSLRRYQDIFLSYSMDSFDFMTLFIYVVFTFVRTEQPTK